MKGKIQDKEGIITMNNPAIQMRALEVLLHFQCRGFIDEFGNIIPDTPAEPTTAEPTTAAPTTAEPTTTEQTMADTDKLDDWSDDETKDEDTVIANEWKSVMWQLASMENTERADTIYRHLNTFWLNIIEKNSKKNKRINELQNHISMLESNADLPRSKRVR